MLQIACQKFEESKDEKEIEKKEKDERKKTKKWKGEKTKRMKRVAKIQITKIWFVSDNGSQIKNRNFVKHDENLKKKEEES